MGSLLWELRNPHPLSHLVNYDLPLDPEFHCFSSHRSQMFIRNCSGSGMLEMSVALQCKVLEARELKPRMWEAPRAEIGICVNKVAVLCVILT